MSSAVFMTFSRIYNHMPSQEARLKLWHLLVLFCGAALFRWVVTPNHNLAEDSFVLIEAGKHLLQTGEYRVPAIGAADMLVHQRLPSWPVGLPLALAGVFSVFGAEEEVARLFTIFSSSLLAPLTAAIAFLSLGNVSVAIGAGILTCIHPLAVAFGGQIFTNNFSIPLFFAGFYFLFGSLVKNAGGLILSCQEVAADRRRLSYFSIAFLAFGFMLTVRDTDAMLALPVLYLLWKAKFFEPLWNFHFTAWKPWRTLVGIASGMLIIGWSPSLYFNTINFGMPFVSTHYATGIHLIPEYLFQGGETLMGMPGILVMLLAVLAYHFPFFAMMMFSRPHWTSLAPVCIMGLMVMFPVMLIHGMFPSAAGGAAPRYVLPLVPFTAIFTAYGISLLGMKTWQRFSIPFVSLSIIWLLLMTYPPSSLFQVWPRFVYLANYAPAYVMKSYRNYPDHANVMAQWVRKQTPANAVIIAPSNRQHYFHYGKRNVIVLSDLKFDQWKVLAGQRPVYLVEDHKLAVQPERLASLRHSLSQVNVHLEVVGSVQVFSPVRGEIAVHVYRVLSVS